MPASKSSLHENPSFRLNVDGVHCAAVLPIIGVYISAVVPTGDGEVDELLHHEFGQFHSLLGNVVLLTESVALPLLHRRAPGAVRLNHAEMVREAFLVKVLLPAVVSINGLHKRRFEGEKGRDHGHRLQHSEEASKQNHLRHHGAHWQRGQSPAQQRQLLVLVLVFVLRERMQPLEHEDGVLHRGVRWLGHGRAQGGLHVPTTYNLQLQDHFLQRCAEHLRGRELPHLLQLVRGEQMHDGAGLAPPCTPPTLRRIGLRHQRCVQDGVVVFGLVHALLHDPTVDDVHDVINCHTGLRDVGTQDDLSLSFWRWLKRLMLLLGRHEGVQSKQIEIRVTGQHGMAFRNVAPSR
mmetsp:Transcript_34716/g.57871  ORF Transcript_34716/g.57871 Transcript_34716/m.57871 type:complete len:349 (+) Transcript_34716:519-1565(+)